MGPDVESDPGGYPLEDAQQRECRPIIKPKRGIYASPLEEKLGRCARYSFTNMTNTCVNDETQINRLLICEFKNLEDVKMYSRLHAYDDTRGLYLENGHGQAAGSGGDLWKFLHAIAAHP